MEMPPPAIPTDLLAKWQHVIDLAFRMASVPAAGLILKTGAPHHDLLMSSDSQQCPYRVGDRFTLGPKLYCQGVIECNGEPIFEDVRDDPRWCENDELEQGMSFSMCYPPKLPTEPELPL